MNGTGQVALAATAFVGTHFVLSHPLRAQLVRVVTERGFLLVYSLVAAGTLGWMAHAYRHSEPTPLLWPVGDLLWAIVSAAMLVASVLLVGSLVGNPAMVDPGIGSGGQTKVPDAARGVFAITRHPMMWAFALWGLCHIAVYPVAANIVVAVAVIVLALVGAALQDAKKAGLQPDSWPAWQAKTSYLPFAAIASGRARFGGVRAHDLVGGLVVWIAATWSHMPLAGVAAGIWRWV